MNEQFFKLTDEKQLQIINAALEVFALNDYKRAVTDEIAFKANISKGLLFYYFHNKKSLYLYLFNYVTETMKQSIADEHFWKITDFFERIQYAGMLKFKIMEKNPYIMDFTIRAFYSQKDDVSGDMNHNMSAQLSGGFDLYFKGVDFSKFKESVNPRDIYNRLIWMTDGYMHNQKLSGQNLKITEIMSEFESWSQMFRQVSYKSEYLTDGIPC